METKSKYTSFLRKIYFLTATGYGIIDLTTYHCIKKYSRCLLFNKVNCQESGPGSLCKT